MKSSALEGKTVLVVGGSSGMGKATAKMAVASGADVIIAGRHADKLARAEQEFGTPVRKIVADIEDEAQVIALYDQIPSLDHVVVTGPGPFFSTVASIETAAFQEQFNGKFWGQFRVAKYAIPKLSERGSVVLMSGAYSVRPDKGSFVMAAINGAIEAFGRALAVEIAPKRVNIISPGLVDTPLIAEMMTFETKATVYESVAESLLTRRIGAAEDVAQAIIMLLSNPHMTGNTLFVDGGMTLR